MNLEKRIEKTIKRVQKFTNMCDWDFSFQIVNNEDYVAKVNNADYSRFAAFFDFNKFYLEERDDEFLLKIVTHEICHLFNGGNLRQFSDNSGLRSMVGTIIHDEMVEKMILINEQMNVRLERIMLRELKRNNK